MLWTAGLLGLATLVGQSAQVPLRGAALGHIASAVVIIDRLTAVALYAVLTIFAISATHALIVALIAGPMVSALAASRLTPQRLAPQYRRFRFTWPWKRARHFGVSTTFLSLQGMDVVILASTAGAAGAGIYGAVNKWIQPVSILAGAFASASAPFIARVSHVRDAWPILKRAAWMPLLAMLVAAALALSAPWLVNLMLGPTYSAGAPVLQVLAFAAIPSVANQPLLVALQSLGRDRAVAVVLVSAVTSQLALVAALAPSMGALACAIAVLMAQILQLVAFLILVLQELRSPRGIPSATSDARRSP
jgi:O-antigen/teichoic acid export membrane protein